MRMTLILAIVLSITEGQGASLLSIFLGSLVRGYFCLLMAMGLLYTRWGSFGDYMKNAEKITGRASLLVIFTAVIDFLGTILASKNLDGKIPERSLEVNATTLLSLGGLVFIMIFLAVIVELFFTYIFFFAADERRKGESFWEGLGVAFSFGKKNFKKSFVIYFKYQLLPLLIFYLLFVAFARLIKGQAFFPLTLILMLALAIYYLYFYPQLLAELSDIYIDQTDFSLDETGEE